jgi:hypothetical protein
MESHNCDITVDFLTHGVYYEPALGPNWWEYYFAPIRCSSIPQEYKHFPTCQKANFSIYAQYHLERSKANLILQKYVKIKPVIQEKIDNFYREHLEGHYVIGVHYRGTDKGGESPLVPYEDVYNTILGVVPQGDFRVFVATDEAPFLRYMQQQFPGKIIAISAIRSETGLPVHYHERILNYQKGEEALIDCLLLSKTQFLIKTSSNLSDCSLQFNPTLPFICLSRTYFEPNFEQEARWLTPPICEE